VDVLERVSDGVHVQVVNRRNRTSERGHADDKAKRAPAREPAKKKRARDRHDRS
jgi:hypothetical protein